jgi:hypothetical protein
MFPLFFARRMDYGEEEAAERVGAVASNGGEPLPAKAGPGSPGAGNGPRMHWDCDDDNVPAGPC